jgi:hypothetical protein
VNVTFYFLSEDYEFFLKKLKNDDEIVYMDDIIIDDTIRNQLNDSNIAVVEYESVNEKIEDEKETTTFISQEPEKIL